MAEKISPLIELLNRKDAEIAKLKEELVGAREEIVMLHKNLSPEEQAMMRAAISLVWTMPSTISLTVLQMPKMLCKTLNSRSRPQRSKWQSPLHRRKNWPKSLPDFLN